MEVVERKAALLGRGHRGLAEARNSTRQLCSSGGGKHANIIVSQPHLRRASAAPGDGNLLAVAPPIDAICAAVPGSSASTAA